MGGLTFDVPLYQSHFLIDVALKLRKLSDRLVQGIDLYDYPFILHDLEYLEFVSIFVVWRGNQVVCLNVVLLGVDGPAVNWWLPPDEQSGHGADRLPNVEVLKVWVFVVGIFKINRHKKWVILVVLHIDRGRSRFFLIRRTRARKDHPRVKLVSGVDYVDQSLGGVQEPLMVFVL